MQSHMPFLHLLKDVTPFLVYDLFRKIKPLNMCFLPSDRGARFFTPPAGGHLGIFASMNEDPRLPPGRKCCHFPLLIRYKRQIQYRPHIHFSNLTHVSGHVCSKIHDVHPKIVCHGVKFNCQILREG